MKKVCTLICLIIFSCQLSFSQDWQSVRTGVSQVYSGPADVYIYNLKSIRIDTSYSLDGVSHLKNLSSVGSADGNCFSPFGNSWIGREVISYPNGDNYFINYNEDSLLIRTLGLMGESWVFLRNQLLNLELHANIMSVSEDTFLGITDSVKVIELQAFDLTGNAKSHALNGTQLILSKHYGLTRLIEFFANPRQTYYSPEKIYDLVGMTDPILGIQNLEYSQIYNFEIGDEFHTLADGYYTSGSAWDSTQKISYVIDKAISASGDSVTYTFFHKWRNVSFVGPELYWLNFGQDTAMITYSFRSETAIQFLKLPGEAMVFQSGPTEAYIKDAAQGSSQLYNGRQIKEDPSGGNVHYFGTWGDSCFQYYAWGYPDLTHFGQYIEGCGGPYWFETAYHLDREYKLVYFRKGSETWGSPFNDQTWLGQVEIPASIDNIKVYPNPVVDNLTVEIANPGKEGCLIYMITSLLGKTSCQGTINEMNFSIPTRGFAPGMYVLRIFKDGQAIGQRKFVKQ
ncbi:MAG: T9SS type A sorting domain-containing protein [Bacteroidales bacterium]|nr:T9SS type A sorting domain-containing protein [Bacteroidales bacterium]